MNGIEKITQRIEADAQVEIDSILAEAKTSAAAIAVNYQAQAEKEKAELESRNRKNADERLERLVSVAHMESRKVALGAKQKMVDAAFDRALEKLCSLPEEQYVDVLAALLEKASSTGSEEVVFSAEDREKVGAAALAKVNASGKQLTLSEETRPIRGGFILRDGNVEINCTFDTLVRLQRSETAGTVAKILFG